MISWPERGMWMERFAGYVKIVQVLQAGRVTETHYVMWVNANRRNLCLVDTAKSKANIKILFRVKHWRFGRQDSQNDSSRFQKDLNEYLYI